MDISLKQEYGKKETHLFLPFSDLFRMPIVGLDSIRKKEEKDDKRNNQYYTGGVNSQGGGRLHILWILTCSGLSVVGGNDGQFVLNELLSI